MSGRKRRHHDQTPQKERKKRRRTKAKEEKEKRHHNNNNKQQHKKTNDILQAVPILISASQFKSCGNLIEIEAFPPFLPFPFPSILQWFGFVFLCLFILFIWLIYLPVFGWCGWCGCGCACCVFMRSSLCSMRLLEYYVCTACTSFLTCA